MCYIDTDGVIIVCYWNCVVRVAKDINKHGCKEYMIMSETIVKYRIVHSDETFVVTDGLFQLVITKNEHPVNITRIWGIVKNMELTTITICKEDIMLLLDALTEMNMNKVAEIMDYLNINPSVISRTKRARVGELDTLNLDVFVATNTG